MPKIYQISSVSEKEIVIEKFIAVPESFEMTEVSRSITEIGGDNHHEIYFEFNGKKISLKECCCPTLKRTEENHFRVELEDQMFKEITENCLVDTVDEHNPVTIACVGSDYFATTRLLAKLYKSGYKHFNIINIEKNGFQGLLPNVLMIELWKQLFSEITINCNDINGMVPPSCLLLERTLKRFNNMCKLSKSKHIFLFLEDIGNVGSASVIPAMKDAINLLTVAIKSSKVVINKPIIIHNYYIAKSLRNDVGVNNCDDLEKTISVGIQEEGTKEDVPLPKRTKVEQMLKPSSITPLFIAKQQEEDKKLTETEELELAMLESRGPEKLEATDALRYAILKSKCF